jgi:hypothetical protein
VHGRNLVSFVLAQVAIGFHSASFRLAGQKALS